VAGVDPPPGASERRIASSAPLPARARPYPSPSIANRVTSRRMAFESLVGELDYPMCIVTARAGEERLGCLVGFTTQASIDPPRFAVCLSHENRTFRRGRDAELLGVHWVPAGEQALAELFGGRTGDEVDKFARCAWRDGPGGVPILDACPSWFVGRVLWHADAGDHELYLLEPVEAHAGATDAQLMSARAARIDAGHNP
jgi:flavin reductase (DIM6/NTAB) family NADH-FMN oxidoreductase RutF